MRNFLLLKRIDLQFDQLIVLFMYQICKRNPCVYNSSIMKRKLAHCELYRSELNICNKKSLLRI